MTRRQGSVAAPPPAWVITGASLDLDFFEGQYWDGTVDTIGNIVTVSRASSGYVWDTSNVFTLVGSNALRISNNGLLVEASVSQRVQQSLDITTAQWTKTSQSVTAGQTGLDPSNPNANLLTNVVAASQHFVSAASSAFTSGATYCASVFAKAGTDNLLQLCFSTSGGAFATTAYANFDLNAGTVTATGAAVTNSGIVSFGNGWYRCFMAAPCAVSNSAPAIILSRLGTSTDTRVPSFTPGATNTVSVLWPQTEAGTAPSSPVPNATSANLTRAADNITITGTLATAAVYAAKSQYSDTNLTRFTTTNVVAAVGSALFQATSNTQMQISNGTNTATATIGGGGTITGSEVKTATSFDGTNITVKANGGTTATTASAWGATSGTIQIGNNAALTSSIQGYIKRLAFSATAANFDALTT